MKRGVKKKVITDLARVRTNLANKRTLLAYWRTGLTFLALGAVLLKFFNGGSFTVAVILMGFGLFLFIYGVKVYYFFKDDIEKL
jgi:putative membrane protein